MLNATSEGGTLLRYEFLETLDAIRLAMGVRAFGGFLYLLGFILMAYNLWATARSGKAVNETREVVVLDRKQKDRMTWKEALAGDPIAYTWAGLFFLCLWLLLPGYWGLIGFVAMTASFLLALARFRKAQKSWAEWYERLCENYLPFTILTLIAAAIGGAIQIIPTVVMNRAENLEDRVQVPYTPLELAGRDIYVGEGCYNCHSQMVRTLVPDVLRYEDYSRIGETIYDHPFQWGSKRTGPDLAHEGGNRPDIWHFQHMLNPRGIFEKSTMPAYPWLFEEKFDIKTLPTKIAVQRRLGVPYEAMTGHQIQQSAIEQAIGITQGLKAEGGYVAHDTKIIALIAYLQKLGAYVEIEKPGAGEEKAAPAAPAAAQALPKPAAPEDDTSASAEAKREPAQG
jgi:cytochrome c oxidase cbb3-type subunit I/II